MDKRSARQKRGQTTPEMNALLLGTDDETLIQLLNAADPQTRTSAARILGEKRCLSAILPLCQRLQNENALYARLSASEALVQIGEPAIGPLIDLLGKIGHNQHNRLPARGFYKKSYPLPRDLAGRTLIRIGVPALPALEQQLSGLNLAAISEAIDAIGFICFYAKATRSETILHQSLLTFQTHPVILWKITRSLQSFSSAKNSEILEEIIFHSPIPEQRWEAVRCLGLCGAVISNAARLQAFNDPHPEVRHVAKLFLGQVTDEN